jgi:hypothetical protein
MHTKPSSTPTAKPKAAPRTASKAVSKTVSKRTVDNDEDADDAEEENVDMYAPLDSEIAAVQAQLAEEVAPAPARPSTYTPYFMYTHGVSGHVEQLRVKTKRKIYVAMRQKPEVSPNTFLPQHGLSVCEFTVWQTLNDKPRRSTA